MRKVLISTMVYVVLCFGANAQMMSNDSIHHHSAVIVTTEKNNPQNTSYEVMKAMYEANGRHFQDPRAPRFLFLDRKGRVALGIGGYVKGTMSIDMGGIANSPDFITATIPAPPQPDMRNQFRMDASTSRLFFKLVGRNKVVGEFTVYIESDFRGSAAGYYGMRLRQAYIELWRLKVGRTWSTFCDVAAAPPTIDFQGPSGTVLTMNTVLQYVQPMGRNWEMVMAVETPSATYTTHQQYCDAIAQRVPDLPSYIQYKWDEGRSHIRLSNLLRLLSYRNLVADKNQYAFCWATQLSGVIQASRHFTFYMQGVYGRGYGSYLNDLGGYGYDLIPGERSGTMVAPYALGLVGGVQYTIRPGLFVSAAYSQCRLYDQPSLSASAYRYAQYLVANAFYSPFANCQIGIEYLYGSRHNYDGVSGSAHRINTMIQYNF
ncbi:MAG: porin [Muribaculaceae bacterium]|nr:porin [Muribaculaceae bacterium]